MIRQLPRRIGVSRSRFALFAAFLAVSGTVWQAAIPRVSAQEPAPAIATTLPISGVAVPSLTVFDDAMQRYIAENNLPGGALAIVKDGRLVYARGFGYADRDTKRPFLPTTPSRLASISKTFTAAAIMTLVQDDKLDLDAKVVPLLGLTPFVKPGSEPDPRMANITVRHLLHHTGGWDRAKTRESVYRYREIAADMGVKSPPDKTAVVRWTLGRPLDFDPGTKYAYSNVGFFLLGRIIEKVSGKPYEEYVRERILTPIELTGVRQGGSRLKDLLPEEARYYSTRAKAVSAFAEDGDTRVDAPYSMDRTIADSQGGWIASAVDLARYAAFLDGPRASSVLTDRTRAFLYERPAPPVSIGANGKPTPGYYACGWSVRESPNGGKPTYSHNGGLPGTATNLVRRGDGITWITIVNGDGAKESPTKAVEEALKHVREWPAGSLFSQYQ
jgi:N-acyl-D-amino-acid deacylase